MAALFGLTVAASGGCDVATEGSRTEQRQAVEAVIGDGSLTLDLGSPPSRRDLAFPDGVESHVLQREAREQFEVTVRFADGHELRTPADTVLAVAESPDGQPEELVVTRRGMTLADLDAVLGEATSSFGADPARVEQVVSRAHDMEGADSDLIRAVPTAVEPAGSLEVETVVTALEGRVAVHYHVSWEPR